VIDRIVLAVGTVLAVGAVGAAVVLTRPRPHSLREVVYLAVPVVGAVVITALAWARL